MAALFPARYQDSTFMSLEEDSFSLTHSTSSTNTCFKSFKLSEHVQNNPSQQFLPVDLITHPIHHGHRVAWHPRESKMEGHQAKLVQLGASKPSSRPLHMIHTGNFSSFKTSLQDAAQFFLRTSHRDHIRSRVQVPRSKNPKTTANKS